MELTQVEMTARIVFWSGVLIIFCVMAFPPLGGRKVVLRKLGITLIVLVSWMIFCLMLSPRGLIDYGAVYWLQGQIIDAETKAPIPNAMILHNFYPEQMGHPIHEERFQSFSESISDSAPDHSNMSDRKFLRGVSDRSGRLFNVPPTSQDSSRSFTHSWGDWEKNMCG